LSGNIGDSLRAGCRIRGAESVGSERGPEFADRDYLRALGDWTGELLLMLGTAFPSGGQILLLRLQRPRSQCLQEIRVYWTAQPLTLSFPLSVCLELCKQLVWAAMQGLKPEARSSLDE